MQHTKSNPIHSDFPTVIPRVKSVHEFIKFVIWTATPGQFREPETQKEFAVVIGVCEDTLTDWKRHPQFWPLVQQAIVQWIKEKIPDVVGALYQKASGDGKGKEVELFLRLAGMNYKNKKQKNGK